MLKFKLTHPEILEALARCGHHDQILIADGNFPIHSKTPLHSRCVHLNFSPGMLTVTEVLGVFVDAIPVEKATMMVMDDGKEPSIAADFRQILSGDVTLQAISRLGFYHACEDNSTTLAIATGEQRLYANILLTIGVMGA
jgi:L-fucose mutarotase